MKLRTLAIVILAIGIVILITGFILPPLGVIDNSLIQAFGEIIAAVGVLFAWHAFDRAMDRGTDVTVKQGNIEVQVDNKG